MCNFLFSLSDFLKENKTSRNSYLIILKVVGLSIIFSPTARAQVNVYSFTPSATGSFLLDRNNNPIDLSSGTTALLNASLDDAISPVQTIGFSFPFAGVNYTQFSVSSNG